MMNTAALNHTIDEWMSLHTLLFGMIEKSFEYTETTSNNVIANHRKKTADLMALINRQTADLKKALTFHDAQSDPETRSIRERFNTAKKELASRMKTILERIDQHTAKVSAKKELLCSALEEIKDRKRKFSGYKVARKKDGRLVNSTV